MNHSSDPCHISPDHHLYPFKYIFGLLFPLQSLLLSHPAAGQDTITDKTAFLVFAGISSNAAYQGRSWDYDVSLTNAFSPGAELGVGFRQWLSPDIDASVSMGFNAAMIRNVIVGEWVSTHAFVSGKHYSGFLEAGACLRQGRFRIFGGCRFHAILNTEATYSESIPVPFLSHPEHFTYSSNTYPNKRIYSAIVLRPEFILNPRKTRVYSIAIQAVLGIGPKAEQLADGVFGQNLESDGPFGFIDGGIAHAGVVVQRYF